MALTKRKKRILLGLAIAGLLLATLLAALPVWLPWAFRPLAGQLGARYESYERKGYGEFELKNVSLTNKSFSFKASAVRGLTPLAWVSRLRSQRAPFTNFIQIRDWELDLAADSSKSASTNAPASTYLNVSKLLKTSLQLSRWLPNAALSNGTIRFSENREVKLPRVTWWKGRISALVRVPQLTNTGMLAADLGTPPPYEVSLWFPTIPLSSSNSVTLTASGLDLEGTIRWFGNRANLQAHFDRTGTLPETASVTARNFQVPASLLQIPFYSDLTGSFGLQWKTGAVSLDLNARAVPGSPAQDLPELDLTLRARGDTKSAVVESASLASPMAQVRLLRELELSFQEPYFLKPAAVVLTADVSRQPWLPLAGTLEGQAIIWPTKGAYPRVDFQIAGTALGQPELKAQSLALGGEFIWPSLRITNAHAVFEPNSRATLSGAWNIEEKAVWDGNLEFRGPLAKRWLPPGYNYENLILETRFSGALSNIVHQGSLTITRVTSPSLKPADIQASWTGEHLGGLRTKLSADFADAAISMDASLRMTASETNLVLNSLTLNTNSQPALSLQAPTTISVALSTNTGPDWSVTLSPTRICGPNLHLVAQGQVNWPGIGQVELHATNLHLGMFQGLVGSPLPPGELRTLSLAAGWCNGPVSFDLAFLAATTLSNIAVSAEASLKGTPEGLMINKLLLTADSFELAKASGFIPLTLNPEATSPLRLAENEPLRLEVTSEPAPTILRRLTEFADVQTRQVKVDIEVAGTANRPTASAVVAVEQIEPLLAQTNLPPIRDLEMRLQLRDDQLSLEHGEVMVGGQRVLANARIPLGDQFWESFPSKPLPDWNLASARLRVQEADVAVFAELAPEIVTPQGELSVDLRLQPGMELSGELVLKGARTRPFPAIGPVRNIDLRIDLANRGLSLTNSSVEIGGADVHLAGRMSLPGTNFLKASLPPFELRLTGTNVPLARQPESIIRSDLDLTIVKTNGAPPLISGTATLQNSYFLSDLADLVPGKIAGPERRPPYFSIDTGLLQDWRLGVHVIGNEFMRVRSPLFTGEVSANMRLQGTLKDPVAIGDVSIDSGRVGFPFGSLQIQQGLVSLTSANPYQPRLFVTAESKRFGYDILMEVTGTAESPVIQFISTPPLTSEEILLMLTAGEMPRGDFSFTTRQRAQSLALFLGKDLLSKLGFGDTGEPRLTVTTGGEISETGKATYDVEYRLTDRWSLTGEYDRFGDFNVGTKWRVYSK